MKMGMCRKERSSYFKVLKHSSEQKSGSIEKQNKRKKNKTTPTTIRR